MWAVVCYDFLEGEEGCKFYSANVEYANSSKAVLSTAPQLMRYVKVILQ